MELIFSANNREEVIIFPYVPADIEVEENQSNENFAGLSRNLRMIGNMELKKMSIAGLWFRINPPWAHRSAEERPERYVQFFQKWRSKQVPVRIVITKNDGNTVLNMACTVDSFSWSYNKTGDISYNLGITEYTFVGL